jgi:hypothetical protein
MTRHAPLPISHAAAAPLRRHSHPQAVVTEVPANSKKWRRRNCHSSTRCFRHPTGKHGGLPPDAVSVRGKHASLQPPGRATRAWRRRRRRRAPGCRPAHAPLPVDIISACSCLPACPACLPACRDPDPREPEAAAADSGLLERGVYVPPVPAPLAGQEDRSGGACMGGAASCQLQATDHFGSIGPIHHPCILLPQGRRHVCIR